MSLGLFDAVGPIMHGPSSNHTGGATRIGFVARQLIGGTASDYQYWFHPLFMKMFKGHRTHIALIAGCLGMREYDDNVNEAKKIADAEGISVSYHAIEGEEVDRNTMRVVAQKDGIKWTINGISVGGGSIVIDRINGIATALDGNSYCYLYLLRKGADTEPLLEGIQRNAKPIRLYTGSTAEGELVVFEQYRPLDDNVQKMLRSSCGRALTLTRVIDPITPFADCTGNPPLFTTFEEFLALCEERPMLDVIYDYEINRSGCTRGDIDRQAMRIVEVLAESMEQGRRGNNPLLCGYCSGNDGYLLDQWAKSGKSIGGAIFCDALSGALSIAEVSASGGRVVAVPTSGSAGGLPGTLFAVAKRFGAQREELARAILVSAMMGVLTGYRSSFSGSIGGCQVEVGVGAGMAAAGAVYLAGGNAQAACHAFCFAIKETLGLVCDPLAGPVEVPCIKRNAMGAAVAIMAADMALAGVRSVVPPDQVLTALKDVQNRMPTALRGACIGGLAAAPIAKELQKMWSDKLAQMNE